MLKHPNITVALDTDFADVRRKASVSRVFHTGAIDEFFDYSFGELPYRSLNIRIERYHQRRHQPVAQVNYPNAPHFTRITEMKQLTDEHSDDTVISTEYPIQHVPGQTIPYYPVPTRANQERYHKYRALADTELGHIVFGGRLGAYQYLNMDQAVGAALKHASGEMQ